MSAFIFGQIMKPLDQFTFGNTIPAIVLVERLTELNDMRYTRAVSQFLETGNRTIKAIDSIKDSTAKIYLATIYRQEIQRALEKSENIPESIKSYVANILVTKLKILHRDCDELAQWNY